MLASKTNGSCRALMGEWGGGWEVPGQVPEEGDTSVYQNARLGGNHDGEGDSNMSRLALPIMSSLEIRTLGMPKLYVGT